MHQEIDVEKEMNKITVCACLGPQFGEPFCPCEMRRKNLPRSEEQKEYYSDANVKKRQQKLDLFINKLKERRRNRT